MAALLTAVGDVVTAALGWVGDVATTVTAEPMLLLFCVGVPLVGLGVGMLKRLLSVRG